PPAPRGPRRGSRGALLEARDRSRSRLLRFQRNEEHGRAALGVRVDAGLEERARRIAKKERDVGELRLARPRLGSWDVCRRGESSLSVARKERRQRAARRRRALPPPQRVEIEENLSRRAA